MRIRPPECTIVEYAYFGKYGTNGCGACKGKKQPELNAASIHISRESVKDKNGAVSMILIREKIESVTTEVGLIDAVSSSPASKETMLWGRLWDGAGIRLWGWGMQSAVYPSPLPSILPRVR
ncbi:hypothetical protein L2E82_40959 [Cichorium intybus]|uniref:Uncharacterized protein n=1 Tax=Cichorium intybus TaxID=13427 RepID=A0ACB9AP05_CICIN|nr:hypothetical protein L2E82_40959 [Cichorium intybus]